MTSRLLKRKQKIFQYNKKKYSQTKVNILINVSNLVKELYYHTLCRFSWFHISLVGILTQYFTNVKFSYKFKLLHRVYTLVSWSE